VLGWEPVEIDPLEAFIYKGSRGVLLKSDTLAREIKTQRYVLS